MEPTTPLHDNHRQRMRDKYLTAKDSLTDHELLEMLLFHIIPRKNTNPIAHRLLFAFGSLQGVLEADEEALAAVEGVGKSTAFFLAQLGYFFKRASRTAASAHTPAETVSEIGDYLVAALRGESKEAVYLLLLDKEDRVLGFRKLTDGALTSASVDPRAIASLALAENATRLILAHNHPDVGKEPSDDDVAVTRFLRRAFSFLDLTLEEHYVISGTRYITLSRYLEEQTASASQ